MSDKADIRVVIGAEQVETYSTIQKDIERIITQISHSKNRPNVTVGLDYKNTATRLYKDIAKITDNLKINNIKLGIDKNINFADIKPIEIQTEVNNSKLVKDIQNIVRNTKIELPTIDAPKFNLNNQKEYFKDLNELQQKAIQSKLENSDYKDYYVGRVSKDLTNNTVALKLYNDEQKKAIDLKYKFSDDDNSVELISQNEINDIKQLIQLQEKYIKQQEKIKNSQYKKFTDFDINIQRLDNSFMSGSNKITDSEKLEELSKKKNEILNSINQAKTNSVNGIVTDKELIDIEKLIDEYKILIDLKKKEQFASNKLASDTFTTGKEKTTVQFKTTIKQFQDLGTVSQENLDKLSSFNKELQTVKDSVGLKDITSRFQILVTEIKAADDGIKKFNNTKEVRDKYKNQLFIPDRSKNDPLEYAKKSLKKGEDGKDNPNINNVEILSGEKYIDSRNNEYIKNFTANVTLASGEVKKLNFELIKVGKTYGYLQTQSSKFSHTNKNQEIKELSNKINKINSGDADLKSSELNNLINQLGSASTNYKKQKDNLNVTLSNLQNELKSLNIQETDKQKLTFNSISEQFKANGKNIDDFIVKVEKYYQDLENLEKKVRTQKNDAKIANLDAKKMQDLKSFLSELKNFEKLNGKLRNNNNISQRFDKICASAKQLDDLAKTNNISQVAESDIKNLRAELKDLNVEMNKVGATGQTFGQKFKAEIEKLGVYVSGAAIVMGGLQQIKKMTTSVIQLDDAVTDLSVATGKNRTETKVLLDTYSELGKKLGATTTQIASGADTWLRQGKNLKETNKLIKDTMMLSKLGDMNSDEAAKALTSATKGYQIAVEDTTKVVDKFTSVDLVSATGAGYLATALAETATSARLAGIDMDRIIGYIARVGEVTQDGAESVGTFYKTLFARMGNIKAGNLIDPESGESLSDVENVLGSYGIKLRDSNKEFRNFGNVLDEVNEKWNTFGTVAKRAIAVAFSGTRNQEKFLTLMDGYDEALKYAEISANSLGTAEEKFTNSYLNSIQASQDRFQAQYEQLANTILNSDLIKGTFDTGTGILGWLQKVIEDFGAIPTLLTAVSGALSAFSNKGKPNVGFKSKDLYLYYMPFHNRW